MAAVCDWRSDSQRAIVSLSSRMTQRTLPRLHHGPGPHRAKVGGCRSRRSMKDTHDLGRDKMRHLRRPGAWVSRAEGSLCGGSHI
jgi:hypothetical protein